jgi:hypothetical protein
LPAPTTALALVTITAAWEEEENWGAFLSTKTTPGSLHGEMCAPALERSRERRDGGTSVLGIRRFIFVNDDGQLAEKDTNPSAAPGRHGYRLRRIAAGARRHKGRPPAV